jgi:hypothetical protein
MKSNDHGAHLPKSVAKKLRAIRRRAITLALLEGLSFTAAALLGAMLIAMAIDWMAGWFDTRARYTFTILALGATAMAFVWWCLRPLAQRRTIISTARQVDAIIPQLQERWSTVTELAETKDAPEVRGSEAMIHKVASEAELADASIKTTTIVPAKGLLRAGAWFGAAVAVLGVLLAANFTQTQLLLQRFWMPWKDISLTQVSASPADVWVPKGEPLTLKATVKGRVQKGPAKLFVRPERGGERVVAMMPRTGAPDGFQHPIDEVLESFAYRVRSGDGQTPWHRITAVDRPRISEVKLLVMPPAYSQLPKEEKDSLPHAVRVLEGSEIEVRLRSDQPLDRMFLDFGNGQSAPLSAGADNWYRFRSRPTNSFTFAAAAINRFKLENKNKPSCRVTVYEDLPPSVKILEPSEDFTVPPGETVNVTFDASDDFGLAKAEIIIATTKADGETNGFTIPVNLDTDAGKKEFRKTVPLDPKALGLKNGDQLSYVVQVTDTKQTPASASSAEAQVQAQAERPPSSDPVVDASKKPDEQNQLEAKPESDQQLADAVKNEVKESQPSQGDKENPQKPQQPQPSSLAKAVHQKSSQQQNQASQPPPNEMAMRTLDAGQSSACQPRNITIDEWAGAFDGQKRKKLEIALEPVLQRLDELLTKAQEKTDSLKAPAASAEGLQPPHAGPWNEAKGHLTESQQAIGDLKSRTSGTPYAFVGLQLHNIGEAHIAPAGKSLTAVSIPAAVNSNNIVLIDKASLHITRAREMLADLTRTYETVKRDQQIAEAMQKLNKLYQIFLEDTQALLGSLKGPINSYDRKIAEVDEEFVKKLQKLLEEKKKTLAELARLLSEDPRMLRRYMAMLELQGTSYRDQMTLLAERQKQIQQQVAKWNATMENERAALLAQFRESYTPQQRQVMVDATKLRENMETWLPLDVKADDPQVDAALTRAEKIVQLMANSAESTNAAHQALAELRALRETLPQLSEVHSTNKAKMTAYVANRLADVETLITAQSGQVKIVESFDHGDFPKVAEIGQSRITQDTVALGEKLEAVETQIAQMSDEIAAKASQLNQITQTNIIQPQGTSLRHLAVGDVKAAEEPLNVVVPGFALAEENFDALMRLIIAKLDEAPPPNSVGQAPGLEAILAMLEDEKKAAEGLGLPCRPINVSLMTDWLKPGSNPGQGMGQAQARAAQAQAQDAKAETERLAKQARESAQKALAEARKTEATDRVDAESSRRGEAWNKLVSRLQKDLLQGRDNTPPEQYRQAIENYFKIISDAAGEVQK